VYDALSKQEIALYRVILTAARMYAWYCTWASGILELAWTGVVGMGAAREHQKHATIPLLDRPDNAQA
jgi:hypothetical protein